MYDGNLTALSLSILGPKTIATLAIFLGKRDADWTTEVIGDFSVFSLSLSVLTPPLEPIFTRWRSQVRIP